jgi:hypothetical protein
MNPTAVKMDAINNPNQAKVGQGGRRPHDEPNKVMVLVTRALNPAASPGREHGSAPPKKTLLILRNYDLLIFIIL